MELKIVYSRVAQGDLKEIYNFIRKDSLRYAHREVQLIRSAISKLRSNSYTGKKFEKLNSEYTRELIFRNYRVIYDIYPQDKIYILTIHHHSRLLANNPAFGTNE